MAMVLPLSKKPHLNTQDLNNYRLVSKLPFISKVIARVVDSQITTYLAENSLGEMFQSVYHQFHSTETALICVLNDVLLSLDQRKAAILVLLDLSAAIDTIDRQMLLDQLATKTGVVGVVLDWIKNYLTHRTQFASISNARSDSQVLYNSVPQGSVLGLIFFMVYTQPLGEIGRKHDMNFHLYADDMQLYLSFDDCSPISRQAALAKMEACINDIISWMLVHMLKLNDSKTKFLKFLPKPKW